MMSTHLPRALSQYHVKVQEYFSYSFQYTYFPKGKQADLKEIFQVLLKKSIVFRNTPAAEFSTGQAAHTGMFHLSLLPVQARRQQEAVRSRNFGWHIVRPYCIIVQE